MLADPRIWALHCAAAPAPMAAGLLRLAVVRHHGCIVAVLLGFVDGRRGYSCINGVDQDVPGQSFGTLAFALAIEDALTAARASTSSCAARRATNINGTRPTR